MFLEFDDGSQEWREVETVGQPVALAAAYNVSKGELCSIFRESLLSLSSLAPIISIIHSVVDIILNLIIVVDIDFVTDIGYYLLPIDYCLVSVLEGLMLAQVCCSRTCCARLSPLVIVAQCAAHTNVEVYFSIDFV